MQKAEGEIGNIMWQYISNFKTEGKPMIYVGGGGDCYMLPPNQLGQLKCI